jgi:hypothetical protein
MDKKNNGEVQPIKRLKILVSIDKDLISWVSKQKEKAKSPSINRWVNDVLRRLWAGGEK